MQQDLGPSHLGFLLGNILGDRHLQGQLMAHANCGVESRWSGMGRWGGWSGEQCKKGPLRSMSSAGVFRLRWGIKEFYSAI